VFDMRNNFGNVLNSVLTQENALYILLILTSLKYTVDDQGSDRPDYQAEDNTQTHH